MSDSPKLTIIEIAKQANVSFRTVSKVINKQYGVSEKKRAEIEAIIAASGFRPNAAARALSSSRTRLIALVLERAVSHYSLLDLQFGASDTSIAAGYHLVIETAADFRQYEGVKSYRDHIQRLAIDGAVIAPPASDDRALLDVFDELKIPYVRISPSTDKTRSPYVEIDERQAAHDITSYLLDRGHRDIAFIEEQNDVNCAQGQPDQARKSGFVSALADRGLTPVSSHIVGEAHDGHTGFSTTERLLSLTPRPTAIFAASDEIAFGAIAATTKMGLSVPADISVVGFNDSPSAHRVWPPLTTVHQPTHDMGAAAVRLLLAQLNPTPAEEQAPQDQCVCLPYHIVERDSVRALPISGRG